MQTLKEEQKLLADQAKSAYENYQSSGVSGLTLTIKESFVAHAPEPKL